MELNARQTTNGKQEILFMLPVAIRHTHKLGQCAICLWLKFGVRSFVRSFLFFFVFHFIFHHVVDANSFLTRYVFLMFNDASYVPYYGNGDTHVQFSSSRFMFLILGAAQKMNYYVSCSLFYSVFNSI